MLALFAASVKVPAATDTWMVPEELAVGVTTKVACVVFTMVKVPAVPPVTTTSLAVKLVPTLSLKLKVKVVENSIPLRVLLRYLLRY